MPFEFVRVRFKKVFEKGPLVIDVFFHGSMSSLSLKVPLYHDFELVDGANYWSEHLRAMVRSSFLIDLPLLKTERKSSDTK